MFNYKKEKQYHRGGMAKPPEGEPKFKTYIKLKNGDLILLEYPQDRDFISDMLSRVDYYGFTINDCFLKQVGQSKKHFSYLAVSRHDIEWIGVADDE